MKQLSLFSFVKKVDQDEIENKKIELNKQVTTLSRKSVNLIRKRTKIHLLDGINYSPENCIIKNETKAIVNKRYFKENKESNFESSSMTSTPIKKLRIENKENIDILKNDSFNDSFEFNESLFDSSLEEKNVDIDKKKSFYRVIVLSTDVKNDCKEIKTSLGEDIVCIKLEGNWMDTDVIPNDICHVINPILMVNLWRITNSQGLIVVNPDSLLSGTTLVGSLFCTRKTVLQNYFSGVSGKTSKAMVLGTFIHSIFQECVVKEVVNIDVVKAVATKLLINKQCLLQFYEAEMLENEILKELDIYFPHIVQWIQKTISSSAHGSKQATKKVVDIEENIWSSKYGMKGKVDVTLQNNNETQNIFPLEIKTGKTSFSSEHIGQVILYTLMLSEKRDIDINQGLLLYLKDGKERMVESKGASVMGLIKMRNELSKHLLRFLNGNLHDKDMLPPVLDSERLCSKCEYLSLCTLFSRMSNSTFHEGHAMNDLVMDNSRHLSDREFQFFIRWTKLILLEYLSLHRSDETVGNIVTSKSDKAIRSVIFESSVRDGGNFIMKFTIPADKCNNKFTEGDPVIVSKDDGSKLALVIGFVSCPVSEGRISLSSERLLSCSKKTLLRLDLYHSLKIPMLNLSLMANFMDASEISQQLRNMIIKGDPPTFDTNIKRDVIEKVKPILKMSNSDQRKAILRTLLARNYTLIKGYPGSGKTSCIVSMIKVFAMTGAKILVCSYTHSAVVNILTKLNQKETSFVYLNGSRRTCPELMPRTLESLMESNKVTNISNVHNLLDGISVFGVTCLSVHHPSLSKIVFDLVIIDEAGQITLPISLMPLMKLKTEHSRFVLVGDLHQLPPLVTNSKASDGGLDQSLLGILCEFNHEKVTSELRIQYRMNKEILKLCNQITYDNCITCANDTVANATSPYLCNKDQNFTENMRPWMIRCLSGDMEDSVVFLNHPRTEVGDGYCNETEAEVVVEIITKMIDANVPSQSIGVISPYNRQVDLIRRLCAYSVDINTIDQYQGKDKSIIMLSLVRGTCGVTDVSSMVSNTDILRDTRRVNVALTRAKHKLIIIGDLDYLVATYDTVRLISTVLMPHQIINV